MFRNRLQPVALIMALLILGAPASGMFLGDACVGARQPQHACCATQDAAAPESACRHCVATPQERIVQEPRTCFCNHDGPVDVPVLPAPVTPPDVSLSLDAVCSHVGSALQMAFVAYHPDLPPRAYLSPYLLSCAFLC